MSRQTAAEVVREFIDALQLAVSCVTKAVLDNGGGYYVSETPHAVFLPGSPVDLEQMQPDLPRLALSVSHEYRVLPNPEGGARNPFAVHTSGYHYTLSVHDGPELLAYHWHPMSRSPITFPHLHLGAVSGAQFPGLDKAHLPSGRVALEDILRLAMRDFGVRPQRSDWEEVLDRTQEAFRMIRSWA